jgi:transcriptional regulator with XRE-family HTH domain
MTNKQETRLGELILGKPSLADIARAAGVTRSYVSAIAAGRKKPSAKVKMAAADVLGLPVSAIFPDEENAHVRPT